jgi:hypothetical protein
MIFLAAVLTFMYHFSVEDTSTPQQQHHSTPAAAAQQQPQHLEETELSLFFSNFFMV